MIRACLMKRAADAASPGESDERKRRRQKSGRKMLKTVKDRE